MRKNPFLVYSLVLVLFCAIGFCSYSNSIKNGFVYDDEDIIVGNVFIKHVKYWPRLFKSDIFPNTIEAPRYYRPLPVLTHALEYRFWGLNQRGYHFDNILLHCCNAFLLFFLVNLLFGNFKLALLTGIFFTIHPIQTSCVDWIVCRDNLLFSFFGLLSVISYILYIKLGKGYQYILALIFFALSLLCKDAGFLFIPLLILCVIKYNKHVSVYIKRIWPFLLILSVFLLIRVFLVNASLDISRYGRFDLGFGLNLLNFFNIILRYLNLLIIPVNLHVGRLTPFLDSFSGLQVFFVMSGVLALAFLFVWSLIKKKEIFWFGTAWFLILLAFVFKAMYIKAPSGAFMSELWLYLPSAGFFLIAACLLLRLFDKHRAVFIAILLAISFSWITLSIYNNRFWENNQILFENALRFSPRANDLRLNLAYAYMKSGDYPLAQREFIRVLEQDPAEARGMGDFYYKKGNPDLALKMYNRAYELKADPIALNNIGAIYGSRKENEKAFQAFLAALKLNKNLHLTYANLGLYYLDKQQYNEAICYLSKAVDLNPARSDYSVKLGIAYVSQNLFSAAQKCFLQALEIDPGSKEALLNLGNIYSIQGDLKSAVYYWQEALLLEPDNAILKDTIKKAKLFVGK
ncbi:MAG: tetratricopeptide repeat protein [Candidatus Omnitrophica bacterium]|nr:tetratricopeptide repeat protein [Candidatus Omnitrophota bacterium]